MRERSLAIQFGLTQQEVAGIDSASKQYGAFLLKIKDFIKTSPTDDTGLASLVSDRKQMEESLANQILQTVRPSTANQLRSVGDVVFQMTGH
ncbi:MAG: hypothetical protein JO062_28080 [Bryobacterales bacterium]|nr:hypothetical protein [Bryobacterales bacterium]